jgi:hypothetical protein
MRSLLCILLLLINLSVFAQYDPAAIWTNFATQKQRDGLKNMLYNRTIGNTFSQPLDSNTEYQYQSAFWAISQFLVYNDTVKTGFQNVLSTYNNKLAVETRRSFLEAIYAVHPVYFLGEMKRIAALEKHPKLFAMIQLWLLKAEPAKLGQISNNIYEFRINNPHSNIIIALQDYVLRSRNNKPSLFELFNYQSTHGQKIVYSFQHENRDVPGYAVIQFADGHFARDGKGKLIMIPQLARSGSNLPYFLTNGNTPQGIYSITGIGVSNNNFIGPTPNLQLVLPNEIYWHGFYHEPLDTTDPIEAYKSLLPASWENYKPMQEAFLAGKLGRTEIIAHGTTIDPIYFTGKMYYPVSPTLGCLCTKEIWDPVTGKLKDSDQLKLVNSFLQTPGNKGYFMVIDYLPENIEQIINDYEKSRRRP